MGLQLSSPFEIEVLSDGTLQYAYKGLPVYLVRDDNHSGYAGYAPRYNKGLGCPPQVVPGFVNPNDASSTCRTPMSRYGWEKYIQKLNGDKWLASVGNGLAMFNNVDTWEEGNDKMESLFFGAGCLVRAVPSEQKPATWARIITMDYEAGPPPGMPTFWQDPVLVQRFTIICRSGNVYLHTNDFYYPVVCRYPVYMRWTWLERFRPTMESIFMNEPKTTLNTLPESPF